MTTFDRIKKATQFRGSNLKKVAVDSGLSENAIYRYNQGIEPKYTTLRTIADTLNVSTDYLLGNTDEMMPNEKFTPSDEDLEDSLKTAVAFGGKPMTDNDRIILKGLLKGYFEAKEDGK